MERQKQLKFCPMFILVELDLSTNLVSNVFYPKEFSSLMPWVVSMLNRPQRCQGVELLGLLVSDRCTIVSVNCNNRAMYYTMQCSATTSVAT